MLIRLESAQDERVLDYTRLTEVQLRLSLEAEQGLYIAESSRVLRRALAAGHRPRSFFMAEKWLAGLQDVFDQFPEVPVFYGSDQVLESITGFHLHRGALAAMHRPAAVEPRELLRNARRVAVLEDIVDHTNLGAIFRSAAGLGIDAVLVTPRCADPLYRRSIRVSMGTVFQVPWARLESWPSALFQEAGFTTAALALGEDSISLDVLAAEPPERLALILGTEGDGLSAETLAAVDRKVMIPMSGGVDSLNVAAASAVAFWSMRLPTP
ncbi:tRNA G18 (ribose-2'-O)-methylase SpoU [Psychromicrobium silvestre]|uniref:tRNA G18 (Ribose-2'-O)-methylase SpoU n=1 Tax=Psychromicrobium silvestre TaxID=1645614 RepID=A0A7Y9S4Y0_9MICC|nr:RNA methyltransferase [Psychromicrobium silvestre]NYE94220.1 tRNA G18 (ribose-2'-O)-methylase SpoU [Psychromicrobium silvestre]